MRLNQKNMESLHSSTESHETDLSSSSLVDHRSYHELEDAPILEVDALTQFETNMQVLADLTARLSYLNREIRYVMKAEQS